MNERFIARRRLLQGAAGSAGAALLPRAAWPGYAEHVARLVAPGGTLLVKSHDAALATSLGTTPVSEQDLRTLLGDRFALQRMTASTVPGPGGRAPAANLFVFQRLPA